LPEDTVEWRVRRDSVPYDVWQKQGLFNITEGNVVDYAAVEQKIVELSEMYNIREVCYDRWGATQMSQNLERSGLTVVPFGQGFASMSPPTKELMRLVLTQKITHGGHAVLRWMADNIFVRTDPAGNIKVDKEKSAEKVDGIVAMIMALDRAIRNGANSGSVYDNRGILFI
jgi:phage terminase large subunit-like protein